MYGMVNNAIRDYVRDAHGEAAWQEIAEKAGVDAGEFGSVTPYSDAVTLAIVGESCAVLDIEPEAFLFAIGQRWVRYAAQSSFSALLKFGGRNFEEIVQNLDQIHTRIKVSLPELVLPSFRVERASDEQLLVHYASQREGLFRFVEGLFHGLAEHFGQGIEIESFEPTGPNAATWRIRIWGQVCGAPAHEGV